MNYQMLSAVLSQVYFGNRLLDYLISLVTLFAGVVAAWVFKKILITRFKKWTAKTETTIDDLVVTEFERKIIPLIYFAALYFSISGLALNQMLTKGVSILSLTLITFLGASFITTIAGLILKVYWSRIRQDSSQDFVLTAVIKTVQFIIWGLAIIVFLDNLGIEITALIAGLGIGGVAVAFAAQAVLADIFSYFTIFFDRPFENGDFIIIDDYMGTVEHIGIRTTRLRSLTGEQLIFSNNDLTSSRVRNYKRMQNRRIVFSIRVPYETGLEHLKEIPQIIKSIIEAIDTATFERAHFFSYGDFSLNFEIVYYVIGSDYTKYMDIQQKINYALKEEFDKLGIVFAYPTQTLYIAKSDSPAE